TGRVARAVLLLPAPHPRPRGSRSARGPFPARHPPPPSRVALRAVLFPPVAHHCPQGSRSARGPFSARRPPLPSRVALCGNGGEGVLEGPSPRSRRPAPWSRAQAEPSRTSECATSTAGILSAGTDVPNLPKKKPGGLTHGYPTGV